MKYRILFIFLLAVSIFFSIGLNNFFSNLLAQESHFSAKSVEIADRAAKFYQNGQYQSAIALWEKLLKQNEEDLTIHNNLAIVYYKVGEFGAAIRHRQFVIKAYENFSDRSTRSTLAKNLVDLGQAYNALGRFESAIPPLLQALKLADSLELFETKAIALMVLGDSYQLAGDWENSITTYTQSLAQARQLQDSQIITQDLTNLSRVYLQRSKQYFQQASGVRQEKDFEEAERLTQLGTRQREQAQNFARKAVEAGQLNGGVSAVEAMITMMELESEVDRSTAALALVKKIPNSRTLANTLIHLATWLSESEKIEVLQRAEQIAQEFGDLRTKSFALGALGQFYQEKGNLKAALDLTLQAQLAAQQVQLGDSLYQWQWQAAEIYQELGKLDSAILNYREAVYTLEELRKNLISSNLEFQLDVRERVAPVYRQFISLLLERNTPESIEEALAVKEKLQLAELEDFFKDKCSLVPTNTHSIQNLFAETQTAVIHFFLAADKVYTILQLPNGNLRVHFARIKATEFNKILEQWRFQLEDTGVEEYLPLSQQLYDLLIRPLDLEIKTTKVKQLIFVADGMLRNVPMSALHDGEEFLIEKYPIGVTLGLNWISQLPTKTSHSDLLAFGLTYSEILNEELPFIATEMQNAAKTFSGKEFLNQDFTQETFRQEIESSKVSIVHLATHGQFGGSIERIFLESFDGKLSLVDLENILSQASTPIDLLTLSACETAAGNERTIFGLAGISLRARVRSTLGSLWFINDKATSELITDFYQYWQQSGATKLEALQKAQLRQLKERGAPLAIWASFVLIGEWS